MRTAAKQKSHGTRVEVRVLQVMLVIAATALLPGLGREVHAGIATAAANLHAS